MAEVIAKVTSIITTIIGWTDAGQLRVPRGYMVARELLRSGKTVAETVAETGKREDVIATIAGFLASPPSHSVEAQAEYRKEQAAIRQAAHKARLAKIAKEQAKKQAQADVNASK